MAAKWGSWDNSLVFLKPHFGALWSISPLFCLVMALSAPIYVTVTFACLWCLACSIWGQDAENGIFSLSEASLPITGHSCLPGMSAFLFLFLAFSWEREGSWSGLRWAAAGSWPLPPLHGLLRAGWMACYFTEFPNILAGIIFSAEPETDSTRLWFAQQYIAARGVSKPLLPLFSRNRLWIVSNYCFVSDFFLAITFGLVPQTWRARARISPKCW